MKKRLRQQLGMSLVEILIAVGVLGVVAYTFSSLQVNSLQVAGQISNQSTHLRAVSAIEADVLKDDRFIPTYDRIMALEVNEDPVKRLEKSFLPSSGVEAIERCYNSTGSQIAMKANGEDDWAEDCFYRVSFYKVAVRDRRFPANGKGLDRLPMSRINIQIAFTAREENKDVEKKEFLSRLVTQAMAF